MKFRFAIILFGSLLLLACSLGGAVGGLNPVEQPTAAVPPTPSSGGTSLPIDADLPDTTIGQSGATSCGIIAANMTGQQVAGTITVFPNAGSNQLRAVTNDGRYAGRAVMLNGNCQPSGSQYDLTATFGLDYSATLGTNGADRCIAQSQTTVTSLDLQGLPGPMGALASPFVKNEIPRLVTPRIDDLVVRRLNGGRLPAGGAHCP